MDFKEASVSAFNSSSAFSDREAFLALNSPSYSAIFSA